MSGDLSPLTVLVVDDSDSMRTIIVELLRALGARKILQADDGLSALEAVSNHEIDLAIVDLIMPVDGLTFTRAVRASQIFRFLPIILITGHATRRTVDEARNAGVTEFLAKPLTARNFVHRINEVIHNPRPFVIADGYAGPCRRRKADPGYEGPERRGAGSDFDPEDAY